MFLHALRTELMLQAIPSKQYMSPSRAKRRNHQRNSTKDLRVLHARQRSHPAANLATHTVQLKV
jgi:hypothetical protein